MSIHETILNIGDKAAKFLYSIENIKPKYIIFCNEDKSKTVYQSTPYKKT